MNTALTRDFFRRPADKVARELLGCFLCVRSTQDIKRYRITEVEAYMGAHDLACHAAKGRTRRTEVMFRDAGTIYIYLIYGMYEMLNIVTGPKDWPAAVLIRAVENYAGPGKLTTALNITRKLNGKTLGKATGLWVERPKETVQPLNIKKSPRVGVAYAGIWAKRHLRFYIS